MGTPAASGAACSLMNVSCGDRRPQMLLGSALLPPAHRGEGRSEGRC